MPFEHALRPLFRPKDIEAMKDAFNLASYQDVRANAHPLYERLANGSMPYDHPWPTDHVQLFRAWMGADYPR